MKVLTDAPVGTGLPVALLSDLLVREPGAIRIGPFGSALKKDEYSEGGIRVLGIDDVLTRGNPRKPKFIPAVKYRELTQYRVRPGDILVTNMGTVGRAFLVPPGFETAIISSHLIKVTPDLASVDAHYLEWALNAAPAVVAQIVRDSRGAIMPGFNTSRLKALAIPLPSLVEQRRIADILDKADSLRAKRRLTMRQLDGMSNIVFHHIFGDPLTNSKNWPASDRLGDVAEIVSGLTKGRKLNGQSTRSVPYMAVLNVQDKRLDLSTVKIIDATEGEIERWRLIRDDLLLTEGGDPDKLGRGTLWADELPEAIHQNHIFRVRLLTDRVHPLFLNWLVGSRRGKQYFLKSAKQTTGIASINMTQLRHFPLITPPRRLQEKFATFVQGIETQSNLHGNSLAQLDALFASLQHRAFRGEL